MLVFIMRLVIASSKISLIARLSVAAWADTAVVGVMTIVMTLVTPGYLETVHTLVKVG